MSLLRLLKNMMGRTDDAFVMRYPIELAEPMATCFPGPVFVIDAQKNRILWASPGGLRLARLPASEAKNLTATEFLRRYFASERVMELYEARAERGEYSSPFRCEYGECYVVGVWYAIDSKTKQPPTRFMLVFMDATEMHFTHQNLLAQYAEELRQHTELTHRLMEEKDVLEAHQQELQAALLSARRLYNSFLSDIGLLRRVFSSVEVWLEPKEQIGGDFYFTDVDESAKRAFIVVGDSIGHGMASALLSIYFITELRKVDPELWGELPQLFNYLSGCLSSAFSLSSSNGSDIMISCEMAFLQADLSEQKLSFLGAKRPLWILRRGELYEISSSRIEISSAGAGNVSVHLLPLEKGDRLWVFSDGLTDQLNLQGKKFSPQRLREVLRQTAGATLEEQVAHVKEAVRLWSAGEGQTDDILLLGLEV